jgi:hypothetical protein
MVKSMADKPLIFAMANPDPEITPEDARAVRPDAIIATGRSDYPNQINNVLGFPYIFRGALDVRASTINEEMKIAAANALAELAREDVPDEVNAAYSGSHLRYGPEYLIPAPFDPRLITAVPKAVAQAAMDSGVARRPIIDMDAYEAELSARLSPTVGILHEIFEAVRANPKRIVFAEGEEEKSIRAANAYQQAGYGKAILIGREERVREAMERLGLPGRRPGNHQRQAHRSARRLCRPPLRAAAAQGLPAPRLRAHGQARPQRARRADGRCRRRRRAGHRADPQLPPGVGTDRPCLRSEKRRAPVRVVDGHPRRPDHLHRRYRRA